MTTVSPEATSPEYREQVLRVEPKGIEPISDAERHGRPWSVFTLWFSANVEFATLVTGVLATAAFGLSFAQAFLAIAIGNLLGALFLGLLSARGPKLGVPQLIQSRVPFGYFGNYVPGVLNFITGFSWFAVNTVLGVFAMEYLLGLSFVEGLLIMAAIQIVIAVYGYNLIHSIERWLIVVLTGIFLMVSVYGFDHAHLGAPFNASVAASVGGFSGAFILTVAIAFSYALGWVPYASDYTRYLPRTTNTRRVFGYTFWSLLVSCVWIELLGAALGTTRFVAVPTDVVRHTMPSAAADVTMVAILLGTVTANVLNIYSGALSSLVVNLPLRRWHAAVVVGALGTLVSWLAGRSNYYTHYENFLFLLGYWAAPWLAIMLVDYLVLRRGPSVTRFYDRSHRFGRGLIAWLVALAVSVPFMNQPTFRGPIATHFPQIGDVTYFVSFLVAGAVYLVLGRREPGRTGAPSESRPGLPIGEAV